MSLHPKRNYAELDRIIEKHIFQRVEEEYSNKEDRKTFYISRLSSMPAEILLPIVKYLTNHVDIINFMGYCLRFLRVNLMSAREWETVLNIKENWSKKSNRKYCYITCPLSRDTTSSFSVKGKRWSWAFRWDRDHYDRAMEATISYLEAESFGIGIISIDKKDEHNCTYGLASDYCDIIAKASFPNILIQLDDKDLISHIKKKWGARITELAGGLLEEYNRFTQDPSDSCDVPDEAFELLMPADNAHLEDKTIKKWFKLLLFYRKYELARKSAKRFKETKETQRNRLYMEIIRNWIRKEWDASGWDDEEESLSVELLFSIFDISGNTECEGIRHCSEICREVGNKPVNCLITSAIISYIHCNLYDYSVLESFSIDFMRSINFCMRNKRELLDQSFYPKSPKMLRWVLENVLKKDVSEQTVENILKRDIRKITLENILEFCQE